MKVVSKKRVFEDERGWITDVLEGEVVEYATIIFSKQGARRGDHYHRESVQYIFVLKGRLKVLTQMPDEDIQTTIIKTGDLALNLPMERHAVIALEDSEFLVLTRGPRGGRNYEKDTYRLTESLVTAANKD